MNTKALRKSLIVRGIKTFYQTILKVLRRIEEIIE